MRLPIWHMVAAGRGYRRGFLVFGRFVPFTGWRKPSAVARIREYTR